MPELQQRLTLTADRLISRFGQTITITSTSGSTYNPATGGYTGGTESTQEAKAVFKPATRAALERLGTTFFADDGASQTVKIAVIETVSGADIDIGYKVTDIGGNDWYITGFTGVDDNDGGNIVITAGLRR